MKTIKLKSTIQGVMAFAVLGALSPVSARGQEPPDAFQRQVLPLLERYCVDCHMKE